MELEKGVKWLVIQVLAKKYPLQVHELQLEIEKSSKELFTTQAIHKALNTLLKKRAVMKKGRSYQLATEYILELDEFVRELKSAYFFKPAQTYDVGKNSKKVFEVESIAALDKLWNDILSEKLDEYPIKSQQFCQHFPHAWFNLVHMGEEIKIVNKIVDQCKGFYTLVNGSTVLDEWIGKFYSGKKMYYQMNPKPSVKEIGHCYGVIGDYILEARYPKQLAERLDALFTQSKNLQELNVSELISITHSHEDLELVLQQNARKAAEMKAYILKSFKKK